MNTEPLKTKTDVVIIGGGIAGCCLAYSLAKRGGVDVTLVEKKEISSEASGANFANVMLTMLPLRPPLMQLCSKTLDVMPDLSQALGRDIEYRPPRMSLIRDDDLAAAQKMVDEIGTLGYSGARIIGKEDFRRMEPNLKVEGHAFLDERGGLINPLYMTTAFGDKARELGVTIVENTAVRAIEVQGAAVRSVTTDRGRIETQTVVNASGAWGSTVSEMVGLTIPIETLKCQAVVCEVVLPEWIIHNSISRSEYLFADMDPSKHGMLSFGLYRQAKKGNLLLAITEEIGSDKWVTYEGIAAIASNAVKEVPMIREKNVHIISSYANSYAVTPDRYAVIGPVPGLETFIMNCGYADYGMGAAYGAGEMLAEMILSGEKRFPIDEFGYGRFGQYR